MSEEKKAAVNAFLSKFLDDWTAFDTQKDQTAVSTAWLKMTPVDEEKLVWVTSQWPWDRSLGLLAHVKAAAVLCVTDQPQSAKAIKAVKDAGIEFECIPMKEWDNEKGQRSTEDDIKDLMLRIRRASEFIDRFVSQSKVVVVHCTIGCNRSPTVVIFNQLRSKKRSSSEEPLFHQLFAELAKRRPCVMLSDENILALYRLEQEESLKK